MTQPASQEPRSDLRSHEELTCDCASWQEHEARFMAGLPTTIRDDRAGLPAYREAWEAEIDARRLAALEAAARTLIEPPPSMDTADWQDRQRQAWADLRSLVKTDTP